MAAMAGTTRPSSSIRWNGWQKTSSSSPTFAYLWSATDMDTSFVPEAAQDVCINILSSLGTMDPFGFSVRCVEKIGR